MPHRARYKRYPARTTFFSPLLASYNGLQLVLIHIATSLNKRCAATWRIRASTAAHKLERG